MPDLDSPQDMTSTRRRHRTVAVAAGLVVALLAGVLAVLAIRGGGSTSPADLSIVVRTSHQALDAGAGAQTAQRFAEHGVTRAYVQVKQDEAEQSAVGTVFFPSHTAPVAAGYEDGRLVAFTTALAGAGVAPVAWLPVLHDTEAAKAHPDWQSQRVTEDGKLVDEPGWLCPFDPAVAQYEAAIAREAVRTLRGVTGITLDSIRYEGDFSCAGPSGLAALEERTGQAVTPADLRRAYDTRSPVWRAWIDLRAEKMAELVATIRMAVHEARPDLPVGAFVVPFTAMGYDRDTRSGQDLTRLARTGLDEIVLLGYWSAFGHTPEWLRERLDGAAGLVGGKVGVGVVLDGEMGVRTTRLTLDALGPWAVRASYLNGGAWSDETFARVRRAVDGHRDGPMPRPDHISVVIRIDTEPDADGRYDTVHPEMIDAIVDLLGTEGVHATFMTVGALARRQPEALRRAAAAGHEIGSHTEEHEQLDALPVEDQITTVTQGLASLQALGFRVYGFGAPRNSITSAVRDLLMDRNLEYDGSAAYDPLESLLDVRYVPHSGGRDVRIVVVPFIVPNDWDALHIAGKSPDEMLAGWKARLDHVVDRGEPVFVLDVHQWLISSPPNLAALRGFIQYAKRCGVCRIETLRDAARNARSVLDRHELAGPTSGAPVAAP